jgi:DUF4097 and DUF4098 domain-containing protein YvlB
MRSLTAPGGRPAATAHDTNPGSGSGTPFDPGPGRWIWGLTGLIAVIGLAIPGTWLIVNAGNQGNYPNGQAIQATPVKTITITQSVTSLSVESYGAPIQVTAKPVQRVTVTAAISYNPGDGAPDVTAAVSHGRLLLAAPACATSDCSVGFTVTVPSGVAVTAKSDNGPVTVLGTADTDLDSGGGPVSATRIDGFLTVTSENGNVAASGAQGANIDSGGGAVTATQINGPLSVSSENGNITASGAQGAILNSGGGVVDATRIDGFLDVSSENGNITASGTQGAILNSGGGAVNATRINGPLDVSSENGNITASGTQGAILNSGGGAVNATSIADSLTVTSENGDVVVNEPAGRSGIAADGSRPPSTSTLDKVMIMTGGGNARLTFGTTPADVFINTSNGSATLAIPGGPYAVTADSGGGPSYVSIPTSDSARRSITVNTEGGPLSIVRH